MEVAMSFDPFVALFLGLAVHCLNSPSTDGNQASLFCATDTGTVASHQPGTDDQFEQAEKAYEKIAELIEKGRYLEAEPLANKLVNAMRIQPGENVPVYRDF